MPILLYGIQVWGRGGGGYDCAPQYLFDKIDRVQRRAVGAGVIQGFVSINDLVRKEDEYFTELYREMTTIFFQV